MLGRRDRPRNSVRCGHRACYNTRNYSQYGISILMRYDMTTSAAVSVTVWYDYT